MSMIEKLEDGEDNNISLEDQALLREIHCKITKCIPGRRYFGGSEPNTDG